MIVFMENLLASPPHQRRRTASVHPALPEP